MIGVLLESLTSVGPSVSELQEGGSGKVLAEAVTRVVVLFGVEPWASEFQPSQRASGVPASLGLHVCVPQLCHLQSAVIIAAGPFMGSFCRRSGVLGAWHVAVCVLALIRVTGKERGSGQWGSGRKAKRLGFAKRKQPEHAHCVHLTLVGHLLCSRHCARSFLLLPLYSFPCALEIHTFIPVLQMVH